MSEVKQWTPIWDECEGWSLEGRSQFPSGSRVVLKQVLDMDQCATVEAMATLHDFI